MRFSPFAPGRLAPALLDLLFAPVCLGCDAPIHSGDEARLVCRRCRTRFRRVTPPLCVRCGAPRPRIGTAAAETCRECEAWPAIITHARSACLLQPPGDTLVHQLKYRGWKALAMPLAAEMASVALPGGMPAGGSVVVPVPTTPRRQARRGYNQAEELARALCDRLGGRLVDALTRRSGSQTQTRLQPLERAANVAGAFQVRAARRADVRGRRVLLVDDVLTTGATVTACALALESAGVAAVTVLTFARALDSAP